MCPTRGLRLRLGGLVVSGDEWEWTVSPTDLIVEDPLMVAARDELGVWLPGDG